MLTFNIEKGNHVDISIFDVSGKTLTNLVSGYHVRGNYEIELKKEFFPSDGIFIVTFRDSDKTIEQKVVVN